MIFFGVGTNKYDACHKMVDQKIDASTVIDEVFAEVEQGIKDLETCVDDIESARLGFFDFGVTDMGENNMYLLLDVTDKKSSMPLVQISRRESRLPPRRTSSSSWSLPAMGSRWTASRP